MLSGDAGAGGHERAQVDVQLLASDSVLTGSTRRGRAASIPAAIQAPHQPVDGHALARREGERGRVDLRRQRPEAALETPLDRNIRRRNYYARAKAAGEAVLTDMRRSEGLPVVIFRPP